MPIENQQRHVYCTSERINRGQTNTYNWYDNSESDHCQSQRKLKLLCYVLQKVYLEFILMFACLV